MLKIEIAGILAKFTLATELTNVWQTSTINLQKSPA